MIALRSSVFTVFFYLNLICHMVLFAPFVAFGREGVVWWVTKSWAKTSLLLLKVITGTRAEFAGRGNIPAGAALIAAKHQAFWEVFALIPEFDRPTFILKKELMRIPLFGWYSRRLGMIPVDREKRGAALQSILVGAKAAVAEGRQIIIFPEGTRTAPGAEPDYKPGVHFLYTQLGVPLVPVALNSGVFWPRDSFLRRAGTVRVEFMPALQPGLDRHQVLRGLKAAIEGRSNDLLRAAYRERDDLPMTDLIAARLQEQA